MGVMFTNLANYGAPPCKMIPNTNRKTPSQRHVALLKAAGSGRFAQSMGVVVTKVRVHRVVDVLAQRTADGATRGWKWGAEANIKYIDNVNIM